MDHKVQEKLPWKIIENIIAKKHYIAIDEFMRHALSSVPDAYYKTQSSIGHEGDFITAPEISQMFGEIIAIWIIEQWHKLGSPNNVLLLELGPGTGKMMQDILRTIKQVAYDLFCALQIYMYEINPYFIAKQKSHLSNFIEKISWIQGLQDIAEIPSIVISNEFFDALPIRQFVKCDNIWRERVITDIYKESFATIEIHKSDEIIPLLALHINAPNGAIIEYCPDAMQIWQELLNLLLRSKGSLLAIDYGYNIPPDQRKQNQYRETLQSMAKHQYCSIFYKIGKVDITAHVDFALLSIIANKVGHESLVQTQADFLCNYGIEQRCAILMQKANPREASILQKQLERLIAPSQMGELFKVITASYF